MTLIGIAYSPRQSDLSHGGSHIVTAEPIHVGRLHRGPLDALCKPRRRFWGLEVLPVDSASARTPTCSRCLAIAERLGIVHPGADQ